MKNGFLGSNEYNGRDIHRVALGGTRHIPLGLPSGLPSGVCHR